MYLFVYLFGSALSRENPTTHSSRVSAAGQRQTLEGGGSGPGASRTPWWGGHPLRSAAGPVPEVEAAAGSIRSSKAAAAPSGQ